MGDIYIGFTVVARQEFGPGNPTIRATKCTYLLSEPGRCVMCTNYRHTLHAMLHRKSRPSDVIKCSPTNPTSSTNLRYLTTPQKVARFRRLRLNFKQSQSQLDRLRVKLARRVEERSTLVDEDLHQDLQAIMQENSPKVLMTKISVMT